MRMPPSNDDTPPPWRLGTPHDSLSRLTTLLGTFELKEANENCTDFTEQALVPRNFDAIAKFVTNVASLDSSLSFPSLLLMEEHDEGLERSEAHAKAAQSMAEPLTCKMPSRSIRPTDVSRRISTKDENVHPAFSCHALSSVPKAMLHNLATSFRLLVVARLRAYTTILARHGVSLAIDPQVNKEAVQAVERKLDNLVEIGSRISIENMVTSFQPQSKMGMSRSREGSTEELLIPFIFSAILDVFIPDENEGHERVTVSLQAAGAIAGCCDSGSTLFKTVKMELDTEQLMTVMVQKAARVSSIALAHVNDSTCRHVTAAMNSIKTALPNNNKRKASTTFLGVSSPPVVSPDQMAMLPSKSSPTPLTLDEQHQEDDCEFSVELCESIVDDCFGGIQTDDLMLSPPAKKMRMEDAPTVPPAML